MMRACSSRWASCSTCCRAACSCRPRTSTTSRSRRRWSASSSTVMVLVIVARHIDLSVGSVMGFVGVLIAYLMYTVGLVVAGRVPGRPGGGAAGVALPGLADRGARRAVVRGHAGRADVVPRRRLPRGRRQDAAGQRRVLPAPGRRLRRRHRRRRDAGRSTALVVAGAVRAHGAAAPRAPAPRACRPSRCGSTCWSRRVPCVVLLAFAWAMNSYQISSKTEPQGIPIPVLIWAVVAIVLSFLVHRTRFGRYVFAMGGNPGRGGAGRHSGQARHADAVRAARGAGHGGGDRRRSRGSTPAPIRSAPAWSCT